MITITFIYRNHTVQVTAKDTTERAWLEMDIDRARQAIDKTVPQRPSVPDVTRPVNEPTTPL